ncbi:uncharacterized protein LOC135206548 [Macrobrachium nipponense]|uniref:uncharacterized protein LOC135206548 n=1 Tax=Macrobrachium nipponense TaxID=159736 RepID=UPI0030C7EEAB
MLEVMRPLVMIMTKLESRVQQDQQNSLEIMIGTIKHLKQTQAVAPTGPDLSLLDGLLPIQRYVDFEDFEQQINGDSALKVTGTSTPDSWGEQPSKQQSKTMIDFCMTSGLQYEFNWEGRLGWNTKTNTCKKGFENTTLCGIIINILVNKTQLSTDETEEGKTMMIYLKMHVTDTWEGKDQKTCTVSKVKMRVPIHLNLILVGILKEYNIEHFC